MKIYYNVKEVRAMVKTVLEEQPEISLIDLQSELLEKYDCNPYAFRYHVCFAEWTENAYNFYRWKHENPPVRTLVVFYNP